ncbi:hypothetical protein [Emticicia fluvialis]|uniref:hypothetical protein n=1 Tax=Emticicia fluvialis TaxID=2974474 RepID=UPI0021666080|nr:hypothetical protein [Emticicia fluvialis]
MKRQFLKQTIFLFLFLTTYSNRGFSQSNSPEQNTTEYPIPYIAPQQIEPVIPINIPNSRVEPVTRTKPEISLEELIEQSAAKIRLPEDPHPYAPKEIFRSPELEPYIKEGMSFNTDQIKSGSLQLRYESHMNEKRKQTMILFGIIVIASLLLACSYLILKDTEDTLIGVSSNIKNVDEEALKQNLNISKTTEIDEETLKQKLGL